MILYFLSGDNKRLIYPNSKVCFNNKNIYKFHNREPKNKFFNPKKKRKEIRLRVRSDFLYMTINNNFFLIYINLLSNNYSLSHLKSSLFIFTLKHKLISILHLKIENFLFRNIKTIDLLLKYNFY